jgi:16S rRNA (adenine1518-N6/adenine1519-N6)-dimethyltransferase
VSEQGPPKKRLGQHFLKDPNTARIVASGIMEDDVVLEVGSGRGYLTAFLAERASLVHAVELDPDLLPSLGEAVRNRDNVIVHEGDALRFDYSGLDPAPNKLAANLPYNIASPLVLRLLEEVETLRMLRFMVQLEVARRMAAERGTKDYAAYAVLAQLLARVRISHRVPPTVFDPPPRVHSAVVEMERSEPPDDYVGIKSLVLSAFRSRRKRLVNNLPEPARGPAPRVLESLGYGRNARAEELAPEDFAALYVALSWALCCGRYGSGRSPRSTTRSTFSGFARTGTTRSVPSCRVFRSLTRWSCGTPQEVLISRWSLKRWRSDRRSATLPTWPGRRCRD